MCVISNNPFKLTLALAHECHIHLSHHFLLECVCQDKIQMMVCILAPEMNGPHIISTCIVLMRRNDDQLNYLLSLKCLAREKCPNSRFDWKLMFAINFFELFTSPWKTNNSLSMPICLALFFFSAFQINITNRCKWQTFDKYPQTPSSNAIQYHVTFRRVIVRMCF